MEANRRCCWNHFLSMCADFTELHLNAPSLNSHALCWAVQVKWGCQVGVSRWSEGGRGSAGDWRFHASVEINDHFSVFTDTFMKMSHMQFCTCPVRALWREGGLSDGGDVAYPLPFGRRPIPILSMGGGLSRRRGDSTTLLQTEEHGGVRLIPASQVFSGILTGDYLCLSDPCCFVSMELMDRRSSGTLLMGKLLFLFGSMTSFSILIRWSDWSSFAVSSSPTFTPTGRDWGAAWNLKMGWSTCWIR